MEVIGEVSEIIYKNEMNGYTIAILQTEGEEGTIVGYLPFVNQGDYLKVIREKGRTSRLWGTNQSRNF